MKNRRLKWSLIVFVAAVGAISSVCLNQSSSSLIKARMILSLSATVLAGLSAYLLLRMEKGGYLKNCYRFVGWLLFLLPLYLTLTNLILAFVKTNTAKILAMSASTLFGTMGIALMDTKRFAQDKTIETMMKWTSICFIMISAILLILEVGFLLNQ